MTGESAVKSDAEGPLRILLQKALTKGFKLEEGEVEVAEAEVIGYMDRLYRCETIQDAWQQQSFYELIADNAETQETASKPSHELFVGIFRSNRQMSSAAIDFQSYFPATLEELNIPPIPIPIVPISYRVASRDAIVDEVTVASWIPGLELEMRTEHGAVLNEFFGARRVSCLWSKPEAIRKFLITARRRIRTVARVPAETLKGIKFEQATKQSRPWLDFNLFEPNREMLREFGLGRMQLHSVVPIYWNKPFLTLALSKPLSPQDKASISQGFESHGTILSEVMADEQLIKDWINREASHSSNITKFAEGIRVEFVPTNIGKTAKTIDLLKIQKNFKNRQPEDVVEMTLAAAIDTGASDIKFQSLYPNHSLKIQFKEDGDWTDPVIVNEMGPNVLAYLKTAASLKTEKVEKPQDGKFRRRYSQREYLFRVNTTYNFNMETAILRVQREADSIQSLEGLGVPTDHCAAIRDFMRGPHGLMILTGPGGSGKSTTIYSILKEQPAKRINIITGEAPIEVVIPNITQDEISEDGRYTFADFVRSLVRRSTDIAVVQEIRDAETGSSLIGIFNTAVKVISTLHTNSAAHIPDRLEYFGIPAPYTASVLKIGLHQRLVKKVCQACAEIEPIPWGDYLRAVGIKQEWLGGATKLLRGIGCPKCGWKGYRGRTAIFEALIVDREIELAITQKRSPRDLREMMTERGETTLFEKAVRQAAAHVISFNEALILRSTND
jgi:type II secretory ATPase GspE/PulE/Tfp pilus assembly ATPase PilB-like protein